MKKIFVIILFLFVSSASAQEKAETIKLPALLAGYGIEEIDLKDFFTDNDGCFVLLNPVTKDIKVYNPEQAAKRYIPASTFKIPNSIIALETGVADGPGFVIKWDSTNNPAKDYWPQSWRKDQTLKTAFQNSVVWYYREIARRIGEERMQEYINKFDYGNKNIVKRDCHVPGLSLVH